MHGSYVGQFCFLMHLWRSDMDSSYQDTILNLRIRVLLLLKVGLPSRTTKMSLPKDVFANKSVTLLESHNDL